MIKKKSVAEKSIVFLKGKSQQRFEVSLNHVLWSILSETWVQAQSSLD